MHFITLRFDRSLVPEIEDLEHACGRCLQMAEPRIRHGIPEGHSNVGHLLQDLHRLYNLPEVKVMNEGACFFEDAPIAVVKQLRIIE